MNIKKILSILLSASILTSSAAFAADGETTQQVFENVILSDDFNSYEINSRIENVKYVDYVAFEDDTTVAKISPYSNKSMALKKCEIPLTSGMFYVSMDVKFEADAKNVKLKIDLGGGDNRVTAMTIMADKLLGNQIKDYSDTSDLIIATKNLKDEWHKITLEVTPRTGIYNAYIDDVLCTPNNKYYLKKNTLSASGVDKVYLVATGNSHNEAVYIDNFKIYNFTATESSDNSGAESEVSLEGIIGMYNRSASYMKESYPTYVDVDNFNVFPQRMNGTFYLPMKLLSTAFGVSASYVNGDLNMKLGSNTLSTKVDSTAARFNGTEVTLDYPIVDKGGFAYVSIDDFCTQFDKFYSCDEAMNVYAIRDTGGQLSDATYDEIARLIKVEYAPDKETRVPIVYKTNKTTVYPDETVMLFGGNFDLESKVVFKLLKNEGEFAVNVKPEYETEIEVDPYFVNLYSVMAVLPETAPHGLYAAVVKNSVGESEPIYVNKATPWWYMADNFARGTQGGNIKVMGSNFAIGDRETSMYLYNAASKSSIKLQIQSVSNYDLVGLIPESIAPGEYEIYVSNGYGGSAGFNRLDTIQIDEKVEEDEIVINIAELAGVTGNELSVPNVTDVVLGAIESLSSTGGVLYFPGGRYTIKSELILPPGVTLRGAGMERTVLNITPTVLPYIMISGTHDFTIEDMTIYMHSNGAMERGICGNSNISIRNVRLRTNPYMKKFTSYRTDKTDELFQKSRMLEFTDGKNIEIVGCDILSLLKSIDTTNIEWLRVTDNVINHGGSAYQLYLTKRILFENNLIKTTSYESSGGGLGCAHQAFYFVYFANNTYEAAYGADRELFTLDDHGTAYWGGISKAEGTSVTLSSDSYWNRGHKDSIEKWDNAIHNLDNDREWHGITLRILTGRGAGQERNLVGMKDLRNFTIDKPFDVEPDETSVAVIGTYMGKIICYNNSYYEGGTAVQLYMISSDCIVANNYSKMCAHNSSSTARYPSWGDMRWDIAMFDEFVDNVQEDLYAWEGGFTKMSLMAQNVIDYWTPPSIGHIMKRNSSDGAGGNIQCQGIVASTILEHNTSTNSPYTVYLSRRYENNIQRDLVIRKNTGATVSNVGTGTEY